MTKERPETVLCQICKKTKEFDEVIHAELVRDPIAETIRKTYPEWSSTGFICLSDLNQFGAQYVRDVLESEKGGLTALEERVVRSLKEQELLSENVNLEFDRKLTVGQRLADQMAAWAGSWSFIIGFGVVLLCWIVLNAFVLIWKPFDPYPFILLNLVLSCLAAIQAPVIMMSQNRQEAKDRLHAEHDYRVNLKAELEIRHLHEKMDHLLVHQWQRLLEIQEIQLELMEEMADRHRQTE